MTPTGDFRCWGESGVSADVLQWPSSTQRGPHLNLENMGVQVELAGDRVGSSRPFDIMRFLDMPLPCFFDEMETKSGRDASRITMSL